MATFRLDRSLTLNVARRMRWAGFCGQVTQLPVLMYHSISDDDEKGVAPYYRVATSPQRFAEHMKWLAEWGYRGVSLEEALTFLVNGEPAGDQVAITFDDGFSDFYTCAWPVLEKHQFAATLYLPTGYISKNRKCFKGKKCLTWDEVRRLRSRGIRFGSHTVNHPKLYELSWAMIERELQLSKNHIEQELGERVGSFAYPFAFPREDHVFTKHFRELLVQAGYQNCATTVIGRVRAEDNLFGLKRLPANSCDDEALFNAKLNGAYDWLALPQTITRRIRARLNESPAARRTKLGAGL